MKSLCCCLVLFAIALAGRAESALPHLRAQGTATQLIVDDQPFLIRGGEVDNSSATNPNTFESSWSGFEKLRLNTVIVPVDWDFIEPAEGRFDFSTVDQLLHQAREHRMHLVLLWFGTWKNSMSCYVPAWMKPDVRRFPRAVDRDGHVLEILTPFSDEGRRADVVAFAALMRHLRDSDRAHTVVMIQVENEIGMIPSARDHSAAADRAFAEPVPAELMSYLAAHSDQLTPELKATWSAAGAKHSGTWGEVFGPTPAGEEIFMAWNFARYTEAVAAAGKKEYPLPLYVNAALIRPGYQPGQYPSAGPLPHVFDVWRAGAPSIDIFAPDIYFSFSDWAQRYRQGGNPLFIPETLRGGEAPVNALFAFGELDALGFSPFGIDSIKEEQQRNLAASYDLISQLEPLIVAHQGTGTMAGLLSSGPDQKQPLELQLGSYQLSVKFETTRPAFELPDGAGTLSSASEHPTSSFPAGGLVMALGPDEYLFAGIGITITFRSAVSRDTVGILSAEKGKFVHGAWQNILWLGGDQTNQGRHIRLEPGEFSIQRVKLYRY